MLLYWPEILIKNWIEIFVGYFIENFDKYKKIVKKSRIVIKNCPLFYSKILFKINKIFVKLYSSKMLVKKLVKIVGPKF